MAIFNPVPKSEKDPDYLSQSKGVSTPDGDTSLGVALKGVGDVLKGVVGIADEFVKEDINKSVYAQIDAERDSNTTALEQKDIDSNLGIPRTEQQKGKPLQVVAEEAVKLPGDVQKIGQYAANLQHASDDGTISSTYYTGRLLAVAKAMRAKYPGYRDYIDQQISQVTGINPANQYIKDVMHDLNTARAGAKSEASKFETYVHSNFKIPGVFNMYQDYQRGGKSTKYDIEKTISDYKVMEEKLDINKKFREQNAGNIDDNIKNAKMDGEAMGVERSGQAFNQIMLGAKVGTSKDLLELLQRQNSASGGPTLDTKQSQQLGEALRTNGYAKFKIDYRRELDAKGITKLVTAKVANEMVEAHAENFKIVGDLIYHEQHGAAAMAANRVKGMKEDTAKTMYENEGVGPMLLNVNAIRAAGGETFAADVYRTILRNSGDLKMGKFFENNVFKTTAQLNKDSPLVLKDVFANAKEVAKKTGNERELPLLNSRILDVTIAHAVGKESSDEIKKNSMLTLFHPKNREFLAKMDRVNIRPDGTEGPGRFAAWNKVTSEKMTDAVIKLKDPEVTAMYLNWTKETLTNDLLSKEFARLRELQVNPNVKFGWDTENKRWVSKDVQGTEETKRTTTARRPAERSRETSEDIKSINLMNSALVNFKNIAKISNEPVEALIIRTLQEQGFSEERALNNPDNLLGAIKQGLLDAAKGQLKKQMTK